LFNDPNETLTGLYSVPLRDGMYSRAIDATQSAIDIKLNVTFISGTQQVRIFGRKLVPYGIRHTSRNPQGGKVVTEVTPKVR